MRSEKPRRKVRLVRRPPEKTEEEKDYERYMGDDTS
jgi:hypothetical protein